MLLTELFRILCLAKMYELFGWFMLQQLFSCSRIQSEKFTLDHRVAHQQLHKANISCRLKLLDLHRFTAMSDMETLQVPAFCGAS